MVEPSILREDPEELSKEMAEVAYFTQRSDG